MVHTLNSPLTFRVWPLFFLTWTWTCAWHSTLQWWTSCYINIHSCRRYASDQVFTFNMGDWAKCVASLNKDFTYLLLTFHFTSDLDLAYMNLHYIFNPKSHDYEHFYKNISVNYDKIVHAYIFKLSSDIWPVRVTLTFAARSGLLRVQPF